MELFCLKDKNALDKYLQKVDFSNFSPSSLATINNNNLNISITSTREDAYICLQNSSMSLEFEILKTENKCYVDNNQVGWSTFDLLLYLVKLNW